MNYRHAFHAGNHADILKHVALSLSLARLTEKPKPLFVLDTHAGRGLYDIAGPEAARTGEAADGIGRVRAAAAPPPEVAASLAPYLSIVHASAPRYPGSPAVARALLRPTDRLALAELHPADCAALAAWAADDSRLRVWPSDGYGLVRALLPPPERRGLILIDPPFERPDEATRIVRAAGDALRRFSTGTLMVWMPRKPGGPEGEIRAGLAPLAADRLTLALDLPPRLAPRPGSVPLAGSVLEVLNPPYGLAARMRAVLPWLCATLGAAGWQVDLTGDG